MDLALVPFPKLSDYNFFVGELKNLEPVYGVLPFKPTSELFTDYAEKKRFIWMPKDTKATYNTDHDILELPVGAALIKNFYYKNVLPFNTTQIIETRLLIHQQTGWILADYVWNAEQTEAFLDNQGSTLPISWVAEDNTTQSINYVIPGSNACISCHSNNLDNFPIGIKPQNLNSMYTYADGAKNQLSKLVEFGYLEDNLPANITSVVDYNDTTKSLDLRVRSYFDINCAHCHEDGGSASYVEALRLPFYLTSDPVNMGVCVGTQSQPPGIPHGYIVAPNNVGNSVLYYEMNTNNTFWRMPRLGRTVIHTQGNALVEQWINSLPACE
jgi:uncharacterized repeat protein (TIGR03806 family)